MEFKKGNLLISEDKSEEGILKKILSKFKDIKKRAKSEIEETKALVRILIHAVKSYAKNRDYDLDKKPKTTNFGLAYNVGAVTVSAQQIKTEGVQGGFGINDAAGATNGGLAEELKGQSVGIAYAASKDLTLGLAYGKADSNHATSVRDEKTVIASVGYSLGAVGVKAQVADVENYAGLANNDGKTAKILMFTSF